MVCKPYLRPLMRASRGRFVKTWQGWNAWRTLAHEYVHHLGFEHGASWGNAFERRTLRVLRKLADRAGLPAEYETWLLGKVRQYHKETRSVSTAVPRASAAPWIGIADNEIGETTWGREQVRHLGIPAVRVFVYWQGEESPDGRDLSVVFNAMASGARVFVTVTQPYRSSYTPTTQGLRARYAEYVARLVEQTGVRDVLVWNEANLPSFWGGEVNPVLYAKLLARTYDRLTPIGVRTWAFSTARVRGTTKLIRGVGDWYRRSKRPRPLFYGVSHHPYSLPGETWDTGHAGGGAYTVADTGRLLDLYDRAFARTPQCRRRCTFPVIYGELGWATSRMNEVPLVSGDEQASTLLAVRDYLARFPRVEGVFNFELRDSDGWSTGLFNEDGSPKLAAYALYGRAPLPAPGERAGAHDLGGGW